MIEYTVHFCVSASGWQWDDTLRIFATPRTLREQAACYADFIAGQRMKYHGDAAMAWPHVAHHYERGAGWITTEFPRARKHGQ